MLLLVEDNEYIIKGLVYSLKQNGYEVMTAKTVSEAKIILANEKIDLCILDIMLPDGNGKDLYREAINNIPTIFLTAIDEEEEIVNAFEMGANDYLTKPFKTGELLARIKRLLIDKEMEKVITVKNITFDTNRMIVYKDKQELSLTPLELKILLMFFKNLNKVITREMIIDRIWELTGNDVYDNTVTVYLKRIREKVGDDLIVTIKGIGYRVDKDK